MSSDTSPEKENGPLSQRRLFAIFAVLLLTSALDLIDATVANIAAPTIATDLGTPEFVIKWLGAGYALAMGVVLVPGGRLGDRFGQKRIFLIGVTGFTLASAACGIAVTSLTMITARSVQGACAALMIPQGMAIMIRTFPPAMRQTAFSIYGPLLGVAAVGGPVLGGIIISADLFGLTWRPIFLVNIFLGFIVFAAALRVLPADEPDRGVNIDSRGASMLGAATASLTIGFINGPANGWSAPSFVTILIGVIILAVFANHQRSSKSPLLPPSLFKNAAFTSGMILGLFYFAAVSGLGYIISLYLQQVLGASALLASQSLLSMPLGILVGSAVSGRFIANWGRLLIRIGIVVSLGGATWILALILNETHVTVWDLTTPILVIGYGMGSCFSPIFSITLGTISEEEAGSASGSFSAVQQLANGIGSAVVATFYLSDGSPDAGTMAISLAGVITMITICLPLTGLLPAKPKPST